MGKIKRAVALAAARGSSPHEIQEFLLARGLGREAADKLINDVLSDPLFGPLQQTAARLEKAYGLLQTYSDLTCDSPSSPHVSEESDITPQRFFEEYCAQNRPVVIRNFVSHWPAVSHWSPSNLAKRLGDAPVSVCIGREDAEHSELDFDEFEVEMPFDEFVSEVLRQSPTNDLYLSGRNFAFARPEFMPLLSEIPPPHGFVVEAADHRATKLWLGPAGTLTAMHHDCTNALFCQVYGRKRFHLVPSFSLPHIRNDLGVYSAFDAETCEGLSTEQQNAIRCHSVDVLPGDALFLPVGWWHQVRALDVSISVTLQAFAQRSGNVRWKRGYWIPKQD